MISIILLFISSLLSFLFFNDARMVAELYLFVGSQRAFAIIILEILIECFWLVYIVEKGGAE